jgi:hypothetical protein
MQDKEFKSTLAEVVKLLEPLSETEKRQAFALLQGMIIGKELAEQKETA